MRGFNIYILGNIFKEKKYIYKEIYLRKKKSPMVLLVKK